MMDHSKKRGVIKWILLDIYLFELMWDTTDDPATPLDIFFILGPGKCECENGLSPKHGTVVSFLVGLFLDH